MPWDLSKGRNFVPFQLAPTWKHQKAQWIYRAIFTDTISMSSCIRRLFESRHMNEEQEISRSGLQTMIKMGMGFTKSILSRSYRLHLLAPQHAMTLILKRFSTAWATFWTKCDFFCCSSSPGKLNFLRLLNQCNFEPSILRITTTNLPMIFGNS